MHENHAIDARFLLRRKAFVLDVNLRLNGQGITVIQGPSGSGKTTLLRCIAGLEHPDEGFLCVNGKLWQDSSLNLPTHKRPIGYVFQEDSLFEHLSAQNNILFGCSPRSEISTELGSIIQVLGISHLLDRKPASLSGGERQRVAIARAFAMTPELLLMDEPLSALDVSKRQEILDLISEIQTLHKTPIIYVTHAPTEAEQLTDQIIVLDTGQITHRPLGDFEISA